MAVWIDIGIIFFLYCSVTVSTFSFAQLGKCYYHSFANFFELGYRLEDCSYIEKCVGSIMDCAHLCLRENGQCRSVNFDQTLSNEGNEVEFIWADQHSEAFRKAKQLVSTAPCLRYFDIHAPVVLQDDASDYCLGSALLQPNTKPKGSNDTRMHLLNSDMPR